MFEDATVTIHWNKKDKYTYMSDANLWCWSIALAFFLGSAVSIVYCTIYRFIQNPAYLDIADSKATVLKFPTVGICPEIYYPEYKVEKFLAEIYYPPGVNSSALRAAIQQLAAFYAPDVQYSTVDLKLIELVLDYNVLTVEAAGKRLSASCEEVLLRCRLFGVTMNCSSLFSLELTNYGFCCIFNGRSLTREMISHEESSILYSSETGIFASLMCVVNNSQPIDDIDITYKWIYVESGHQYKETVGNGTPISPNTEVWLSYDSRRFIVAETSNLNKCRQSTTKLKYFPIYSRRYCLLECEMTQMIRRCQCAKINHPRPFNVAICRASDLLCANNSAVYFHHCDCPVTCDSALDLYNVQDYPLMSNSVIDQFYQDLDFSKVTIIRAYLQHHEKTVRKRQPYYTPTHLFAQIGGIFNVFFGCSVLTLIEVVQLAWHGYLEYKVIKALNKKTELILSVKKKKKTKFKNNKVGKQKLLH